jgi:zinc protease
MQSGLKLKELIKYMLKKEPKMSNIPGYTHVKKSADISEYTMKSNGMTVLYKNIPDTGVVTTNITYNVGARDENKGETGLAHMLEHMLFKPTKQDLKRKIDSGAMHFERETGCILNANTWKDRTTYYFNYPAEHFMRALQVEAERMQDVVITDKEFLPERGNVLSEFDMNNGDPYFALSVQMVCAAFHSHPYGHETIGFREDIERYTPEKLERLYKNYYRPDNATMTVVGDISAEEALSGIKKNFGSLKNPTSAIPRHDIVESIQEGVRRVEVQRPSSINILAIGVKHDGFPGKKWFETSVLFNILAGGPDSILHKKLVDTGIAIAVDGMLEPTSETNLGMLFVTLAPNSSHKNVEETILDILVTLTTKDITKLLKKTVQTELTTEIFARGSSLRIAMDLTEYIAAQAWDAYNNTEEILLSIKASELISLNKQLFVETQLTIGYFIGKK